MRQRKPANIAYDLERFAASIVEHPQSWKGRWRAYCDGGLVSCPEPRTSCPEPRMWREVRVDLGCGKGAFLVAAALAEPEVLFIGIDSNETCVARAAEKVLAAGLTNAVVFQTDAAQILDFFATGEVDRIYLNFNSPFPKKKYATQRLTHYSHLAHYREILGSDGVLDLRTDNVLYWRFSLGQLDFADYEITDQCDDLHARCAAGDAVAILASEYDERTVSRGAFVHWLCARPAETKYCDGRSEQSLADDDTYPKDSLSAGDTYPKDSLPAGETYPEDKLPLSLVDYIWEDIDKFSEIPYGMEDTIANMRNRRVNAASRHRNRHVNATDPPSQPTRQRNRPAIATDK